MQRLGRRERLEDMLVSARNSAWITGGSALTDKHHIGLLSILTVYRKVVFDFVGISLRLLIYSHLTERFGIQLLQDALSQNPCNTT